MSFPSTHASVDVVALNASLNPQKRRVRFSQSLKNWADGFSTLFVFVTIISCIVQTERHETGPFSHSDAKITIYAFILPFMTLFTMGLGWMGCNWIGNLFSGFSAWFDPKTNNSSRLNSCRNRRNALWLVMVMTSMIFNLVTILHQESILWPSVTLGNNLPVPIFGNWIAMSTPMVGMFATTLVLAICRHLVLWVVSWFVTPDRVPHIQMIDLESVQSEL